MRYPTVMRINFAPLAQQQIDAARKDVAESWDVISGNWTEVDRFLDGLR